MRGSGSGSGCLIWFGDLFDIEHSYYGQEELYIRMSASEIGTDYGFKLKFVLFWLCLTGVFCIELILFD